MSEQTGKGEDLDAVGQAEVEGRTGGAEASRAAPEEPAAGPHAAPPLTNPDATPGAGSLPSESTGGEVDAGTG